MKKQRMTEVDRADEKMRGRKSRTRGEREQCDERER